MWLSQVTLPLDLPGGVGPPLRSLAALPGPPRPPSAFLGRTECLASPGSLQRRGGLEAARQGGDGKPPARGGPLPPELGGEARGASSAGRAPEHAPVATPPRLPRVRAHALPRTGPWVRAERVGETGLSYGGVCSWFEANSESQTPELIRIGPRGRGRRRSIRWCSCRIGVAGNRELRRKVPLSPNHPSQCYPGSHRPSLACSSISWLCFEWQVNG